MPLDFSIELTARRINDPRIRDYFVEVEGCYRAGYYRSCIVMLWTVVVCDLLYKLDQLANASGDLTAEAILKEIEKDRESNPDSPRWEEKLLQLVRNRTELLDHATFLSLTTLQKQRHLSAHPVLEENDRLHNPTKEICRSHLRIALEGLLVRPAMMTRKIFNALLEDLEANKGVLINEDSVARYVGSKYLSYLSDDAKRDIFKRIWKLAFRLNDQRCQDNREVNYMALCAFYNDSRQKLLDDIQQGTVYFSDVLFEENCATRLHEFLQCFPEVYSVLSTAAKTGLENFAKADSSRKMLAWYLSDSISLHAENVFKEFSSEIDTVLEACRILCLKLCEVGDFNTGIDFAIKQYTNSLSYDSADNRFEFLIRPLAHLFTKEQILRLVTLANGNSQVYSRRRSTHDHKKLRKHLDRLGCKIAEYKHLQNIANDLLDFVEMDADLTELVEE